MRKVMIDERLKRYEPFLVVAEIESARVVDGCDLAGMLRRAGDLARASSPDHPSRRAIGKYREAMTALGRNPNRYRHSSDALFRRLDRDQEIPPILPTVDLNNIVSLRTGWPVGTYDASLIQGAVTLRVGEPGETAETLGKGLFDLGNLPLLEDEAGAFGSPVSDTVRTSITGVTKSAEMYLFGFGQDDVERCAGEVAEVLSSVGMGSASVRPVR